MKKVLIVEDEVKIISLLRDYLVSADYTVEVVSNGNEVMESFYQFQPDVILLDIKLPGRDGTALCRDLRQVSSVGIIIISARIEEVDRLLGLELGADDYVCKPFSPREVVARVETLVRRIRGDALPPGAPAHLNFSDCKLVIDDREVNTTTTEFHIFVALSKAPGRIFSRKQLVEELHHENYDVSDRAVDSHVKNLRKKLKPFFPDAEIIKSVYGVGYKLEY